MREIKFRAWDKLNSRIVNVWDISFKAWSESELNGITCEFDDGTFDLLPNHFILMQYSGLKDKNGKEIYEGDIVKNKYAKDTDVVTFGDYDNGESYEDDVSGCGWYLENSNGGIKKINANRIEFYEHEIIGNIYENPELAK